MIRLVLFFCFVHLSLGLYPNEKCVEIAKLEICAKFFPEEMATCVRSLKPQYNKITLDWCGDNNDQCIELRHVCSDYRFVAVYLPGFPATEEYTFTCTAAYFINLGMGGIATLSVLVAGVMVGVFVRRVQRDGMYNRQVFREDRESNNTPSTSRNQEREELLAQTKVKPIIKPTVTENIFPSPPLQSATNPHYIPPSPPTNKKTNQNSEKEPLLSTNEKPSCSSSIYQAPQVTKKQKNRFSSWFAKKPTEEKEKDPRVDVTVNIVKEAKDSKKKGKKSSKKIEVPIDNSSEQTVTIEDCPNCPEDSEDENELQRPNDACPTHGKNWTRIPLDNEDGSKHIRDDDLRNLFDQYSRNAVFEKLHRRSPPPLLPFCGSSQSSSVFDEIMAKKDREDLERMEELKKKNNWL